MELIANLFKAELFLRISSALILIPLAIVVNYKGGTIFLSAIYIITILLALEWVNMVYKHKEIFVYFVYLLFFTSLFLFFISLFSHWTNLYFISFLICFFSLLFIISKGRWLFFGILYIGIPMISIIYLRLFLDLGKLILLWTFCVVWATDTFSYFGGKIFKGAIINTKISPHKTWSGFFSGVFAAAIIGLFVSKFIELNSIYGYFLGFISGILVQLGDLFESWVKRNHLVKDSSKLLPGHGGVLDRLDGFILAVTIINLISIYEYY